MRWVFLPGFDGTGRLFGPVRDAIPPGIDAVFVTGGIHGGEPFPTEFGPQNGLGDWHPVAVVDSLS